MKQEISQHEQLFIRDGFRLNFRSDGRQNTDPIKFETKLGTVQEAFGSATVTFGEQNTLVICAIKAEVQKPLPTEPTKG